MEAYKLDERDIKTIKWQLKEYPNTKIINRGADRLSPEMHFNGDTPLFKAAIECRDDVYEQVLRVVNS